MKQSTYTRKIIESWQVGSTVTTPNLAGVENVVEGEEFLEVQATVVVDVELREEAGMNHPVVATPMKEVDELVEADSTTTVRVYGLEEGPG